MTGVTVRFGLCTTASKSGAFSRKPAVDSAQASCAARAAISWPGSPDARGFQPRPPARPVRRRRVCSLRGRENPGGGRRFGTALEGRRPEPHWSPRAPPPRACPGSVAGGGRSVRLLRGDGAGRIPPTPSVCADTKAASSTDEFSSCSVIGFPMAVWMSSRKRRRRYPGP